MKNNQIFLLTILIVVIGSILTYYLITKDTNQKRLDSVAISLPYKCSDGDIVEEVKKCRKYMTYYLDTNNIENDKKIALIRAELNNIKLTGDSINGIHVKFSENIGYKYF